MSEIDSSSTSTYETVATFEFEGQTYELDDLGIAYDWQRGSYAIYQAGEQVGEFITSEDGPLSTYDGALETEPLIVAAHAAIPPA